MSNTSSEVNTLRNINKKQQIKQDIVLFCNVCSKLAKFQCGKCFQVAYCKPQHQKVDWGNHQIKCSNRQQKAQKYLTLRTQYRQQLFSRIARKEYLACQQIIQLIKKNQIAFLTDFPSLENQIEYAVAVFTQVRLLISMKDYNKAHDVLFNYKSEKKDFISDVTNLPKKLDEKAPGYDKCKNFILGKLRVISTLANLSHTLTRTSVDILEILFEHIQYFYGSNSQELGQSYFRMGFFFHNSNQTKRAIACFLKAGLIFGNKGAICYYNAALLIIQSSQETVSKSIALKYFDLALKCIQKDEQQFYPKQFKAFIYQNIALCFAKLDYVEQSIYYMESALCLFRNDGAKQIRQHGQHDEAILQYLSQVRRQWEVQSQQTKNYRLLEFPHDTIISKNFANISNEDIMRYRNATVQQGQQKKIQQWKDSFDHFKRKIKLDKFGASIPPVYEKYIKKQANDKQGDNRGGKKKDNKSQQKLFGNLQIDEQFMWILSSTQVGYLHQLNQILGEVKQKVTAYEALQNSNFFQSAQQQVREYFFKLNPKLNRPTQQKRSSIPQPQGNKPPITPQMMEFFNKIGKN